MAIVTLPNKSPMGLEMFQQRFAESENKPFNPFNMKYKISLDTEQPNMPSTISFRNGKFVVVLEDKSEIEFNSRKEAEDYLATEKRSQGGRAGYQTGGITEQRQLPPEYVEALGKTYAADLTRQAGIPSITTATTQQPGETAEQFAQRQAQA